MPAARQILRPEPLDRRRFMHRLGSCCAAVAALAAGPAFADVASRRSLSFVHTHTGETLTAHYFEDGAYRPESLIAVNQLLRDFRTGEVHAIDPALLDILFNLQRLAGHDGPFAVVSGFRSVATNEMLRRASQGVAEHSLHLQGRAIDVRLRAYPTRQLAALARSLSRGGVGYYERSDFIHVDTGRIRYW